MIHIQEKKFITYNLSLAWDNDSNFKSSAPRQHLVFEFPHHNFQHIRGKFLHLVANINQTMKLTITEEKRALSGRTGGSQIGWIRGRLQKQEGSWCEDEAVLINTFCSHRWKCQRENFLYHPLLYILCKITKFSMLDKQSKKVGVIRHFVVRFLIFWPWAFCIVGVSLSFFLRTFFLFLFFFFFSSFGEAYSSFLAFLCKN